MTTATNYNSYAATKANIAQTEIDAIITSFENLIQKQSTLNDLVWAIVDHVNLMLEYEDCVIYLYDERKKRLVQMAAFGSTRIMH